MSDQPCSITLLHSRVSKYIALFATIQLDTTDLYKNLYTSKSILLEFNIKSSFIPILIQTCFYNKEMPEWLKAEMGEDIEFISKYNNFAPDEIESYSNQLLECTTEDLIKKYISDLRVQVVNRLDISLETIKKQLEILQEYTNPSQDFIMDFIKLEIDTHTRLALITSHDLNLINRASFFKFSGSTLDSLKYAIPHPLNLILTDISLYRQIFKFMVSLKKRMVLARQMPYSINRIELVHFLDCLYEFYTVDLFSVQYNLMVSQIKDVLGVAQVHADYFDALRVYMEGPEFEGIFKVLDTGDGAQQVLSLVQGKREWDGLGSRLDFNFYYTFNC